MDEAPPKLDEKTIALLRRESVKVFDRLHQEIADAVRRLAVFDIARAEQLTNDLLTWSLAEGAALRRGDIAGAPIAARDPDPEAGN